MDYHFFHFTFLLETNQIKIKSKKCAILNVTAILDARIRLGIVFFVVCFSSRDMVHVHSLKHGHASCTHSQNHTNRQRKGSY